MTRQQAITRAELEARRAARAAHTATIAAQVPGGLPAHGARENHAESTAACIVEGQS